MRGIVAMARRSCSMSARLSPTNNLTTAQRGQVIQRVIVDGWKTADAAAAARVPEQLVKAWVADYRRLGMASLRHRTAKSASVEIAQLRLLQPLRLLGRDIALRVRRILMRERRAEPPLPIRRSGDEQRGGP
jgi:hypothetical protein